MVIHILHLLLILATTRSLEYDKTSRKSEISATFLPIVAPNKLDSFLQKWGSWFVLGESTQEMRQPGLLKGEY